MVPVGVGFEQDMDVGQLEAKRLDIGLDLFHTLFRTGVEDDQPIMGFNQIDTDTLRADVIKTIGDAIRLVRLIIGAVLRSVDIDGICRCNWRIRSWLGLGTWAGFSRRNARRHQRNRDQQDFHEINAPLPPGRVPPGSGR